MLFHYECFNGSNTLPAFALSGKLTDFYAFKYYLINIEYWLGILFRIVNIFWMLIGKSTKIKYAFLHIIPMRISDESDHKFKKGIFEKNSLVEID